MGKEKVIPSTGKGGTGMLFQNETADEVVEMTPPIKGGDFSVKQFVRGRSRLDYKKNVNVLQANDIGILNSNIFDVTKKNNLLRTVFGLMAWKIVLCLAAWTAAVIVMRHYGVFEAGEFTFQDDVAGWGFIVGLLLVFRTNQGMQRWWEARMAWEKVQCAALDCLRQTQCHCKNKALSARVLVLLMAFAITLKNSLRDLAAQDDCDEHELEQFLDPEYMSFIMAQLGEERSQTCLDIISGLFIKAVEEDLLDKQVLTRTTEKAVQELNQQMGIMLRIKKTPIPYAYAVLLRLCNFLYIMVTPVVLTAKGFGYPSTAGFTMLFGCSLIAIDETGLQMQDPFGNDVSDLPLEEYCRSTFRQLADMHWRWHGTEAIGNLFTLTCLEPNESKHKLFNKFGE